MGGENPNQKAVGCRVITFYHPTGGKSLTKKPWDAVGCRGMPWDAVGCRGMPWDAVGCRVMPWDAVDAVGCLAGEDVAYLRSLRDLRGAPLEDLSFSVSIAIAYSPVVSHGDAWQVKVLLTFDRCAISGGALEDLSFSVSIAIAYSPVVSHGDAW